MKKQQFKKRIAVIIVIVFGIVGISYFLFSSNPLTDKTGNIPRTDNNIKTTGNSVLQTACKNARNDYPEWTKSDTDLVIWENPDKSFYFRNSPEDASTKLTSPVPSAETLVDMDFIGKNEISYVTTTVNAWKINTLKLNDMQPPDKAQIYEKNEAVSFLTVSPINRTKYIALVTKGNKTVLEKINTNTSKEETLTEFLSTNTDKLKLSASPKGNYVYLLQSGSLIIFEIATKKQIDRFNPVTSAVWIGNEALLYSGSKGALVYNLKTKENSKLNNLEQVSDLTFNPNENGVVAFGEQGNVKIVGCQDWRIINTQRGSELKTLTSSKTAITQKGVEFGYWRFKDADWGVKILEDKSKYVTVWQNY